ncbi:hypothetical protein J7E50_24830 [Pedobacter sp. ISL-68]|uniref:hypothetical protein n=1 Tax=unclassified Pedobacter TaxID=2628915 RepID=UPI001BE98509|nr:MULTISPECIES: hypothetical protein [unclassified Pedobacter]MBT2563132.1 hypothetical protein [Pedobacter sp. ISL-64]MBT2593470.1 hypothetical protein [Pedobacter sp. ISL-68]
MKVKFLKLLPLFVFIQQVTFAQSLPLQNDDAATNGFSPDRLKRIDQVIKSYVDSNWIKVQ